MGTGCIARAGVELEQLRSDSTTDQDEDRIDLSERLG